jgi:hypothetical protein
MSKHDEADLILKLYELRREPTMRKAREWYFLEFNPQSGADVRNAVFGEHSGHLRMVTSYWDMAAAFVNHGAISIDFFDDTNGEHIGIFAKMEPVLEEARTIIGPRVLANLEKLIDATPDGRARSGAARERMKAVRAEFLAKQAQGASAA